MNPEQAVTPDRLTRAQRCQDAPRGSRQGCHQDGMLPYQRSVAARVGHRDHQSDRPAEMLWKRRSLELGRAQLGLDVEQRTLDLQVDGLGWRFEHDIGCSPIRRRTDRHLELHTPAWVDGGSQYLRDP